MLSMRWLTSLVATGAICAAAGLVLGKKQGCASTSSASSNDTPSNGATACAPSTTTNDDSTNAHQSPEQKQKRIAELEHEVERQKHLRAQERSGRTTAEREAREAIQQQQRTSGYAFNAVAHVQSCFVERRGTPRQGVLVPAARAQITFHTRIPPASLECLDQFSHLWVVFVFHENTNATKQTTTFPAKIAPPRLNGAKVGLFSTRTPHRPNSIGLTVVKIDTVDVASRTITISGHDLVDGTPVLDVKPYTFADCVPTHVCPSWVSDAVDVPRTVTFSAAASTSLDALVGARKLQFYDAVDDLKAAIAQMLVLDIRSVHQGRGSRRGANKKEEDAAPPQRFQCRFDALEIAFTTLDDQICVEQCDYAGAPVVSGAATRLA